MPATGDGGGHALHMSAGVASPQAVADGGHGGGASGWLPGEERLVSGTVGTSTGGLGPRNTASGLDCGGSAPHGLKQKSGCLEDS